MSKVGTLRILTAGLLALMVIVIILKAVG